MPFRGPDHARLRLLLRVVIGVALVAFAVRTVDVIVFAVTSGEGHGAVFVSAVAVLGALLVGSLLLLVRLLRGGRGGDGGGQLVALPRPRPLSPAERALLETMARRFDEPKLVAQVAAAQVVAQCSCGCPSIGLTTRGAALTADETVALGAAGRGASVQLAAVGSGADGREVEVTLHLVGGTIEELEVWAGTHGDDPRVALPLPRSLAPPHPITSAARSGGGASGHCRRGR